MPSYEIKNHKTYRYNDDGEVELIALFEAKITEEINYVDGRSRETVLTIEGSMPPQGEEQEPRSLGVIKVKASDFSSCAWVLQQWGPSAVIMPGYGSKEDLRAAIQLASSPVRKTIYRHTGWTVHEGEKVFLHSGGGIGKKGNNSKVMVELPNELSRYKIEDGINPKDAFAASLELTRLAPGSVTWPLLTATLTPIFAPVDFAMHLSGRSGTFKSEMISLFQSHYGKDMDARHLPGSWSSTPNALEAQAWVCKDVAFACDDFIPAGTSWQQKAYQVTADKLIRAQGNQAGRARLSDVSNLQTTMYPRGILLSTGEDTPEGLSVRSRMMIMEVSPGDVDVKKLTEAQKKRGLYSGTTAHLIKAVCAGMYHDLCKAGESVRDSFLEIGHSRTPSMLGRLMVTARAIIEEAEKVGAIRGNQKELWMKEAAEGILESSENQQAYLEEADPCEIFVNTLRHIFSAGLGHVRTINGGIPRSPEILGWTKEQGESDDFPTFKSHGPCIGWIKWDSGEIFIECTAGLNMIRKVAGGDLSQTRQTLMKRLKDGSMLTRTDDSRQRNTVRITAENHPRQVLAIAIGAALDTKEIKA